MERKERQGTEMIRCVKKKVAQVTEHIGKGEPKPSGGLEPETKRSHRMTSVRWVMLTHSFRTAALGQAAFARGSCQETTVTYSSPSQSKTAVSMGAEGDGIATKVETDEKRCSKTLSCFSSEISRGYI